MQSWKFENTPWSETEPTTPLKLHSKHEGMQVIPQSIRSVVDSNKYGWIIALTVAIIVIFIWLIVITVKMAKYVKKEPFTSCQLQDYASALSGMSHNTMNGGDQPVSGYDEMALKYGVGTSFFDPRNGATEAQADLASRVASKKLGEDSESLVESEFLANNILNSYPNSEALRKQLGKKEYSTLLDYNN